MPSSLPSPLGGPAPAEESLGRSPLVRVLAQVRFSSVLRIDTKAGVTSFQERIRTDYPLFEQTASQQMQIEFGAGGPALRSVANPVWRFSDAARTASLSLTTDTMTLEALTYEGRDRFLARWADLLMRLEEEFAPSLTLRNGLRYVNRVHDEAALAQLSKFVSPSLVGIAQPDLRRYILQALSEALTEVEEGRLMLRWGLLPPNTTTDPAILAAVNTSSWILDIDVFSEQQRSFSGREIGHLFQTLSERAYSVFRYAITPAGLAFFGA